MAKKKSKKTSNAMFATACVLLAVIVVLIIFLVKKDQILSNYKQTGFFDRVFGSTPEFVENHEDKKKDTVPLKNDEVVIQVQEEKPASKIEQKLDEVAAKVEEKVQDVVAEKVQEKVTETVKEKVQETVKETPVAKQTTDYQLCFIKIDSDGSVIRKIVKRTSGKTDSPLTTALNLIILGPNTTLAAEKDCMSFIPKGTKLLGARVTDGVAYLNFNDAFEFNDNGVEGSIAQLMQVVYTATAFPTVNSVQILIEGQKQEYLGSEGQWIGSPLSRTSFN